MPKKGGAVLDKKLRNEKQNQEKQSNELKRRANQAKLAEQRQEDGLKRFSGQVDGGDKEEKAVFRKFDAYRKDGNMPKQIADLKIIVDRKNEAVIFPIYGQAVPFHISTLKNVSRSDEQDYVLLRFNFITPGVATGKLEVVL